MQIVNNFPDLVLLKKEVIVHFDKLFQSPPEIDCIDRLDSDYLIRLNGLTYLEFKGLIASEFDGFHIFSLVSKEVARYYLAGYILYLIEQVSECRRIYPVDLFPFYLGAPFSAIMSFFDSNESINWVLSIPELPITLVKFLDVLINTAGFEFDKEKLIEISKIRNEMALREVL